MLEYENHHARRNGALKYVGRTAIVMCSALLLLFRVFKYLQFRESPPYLDNIYAKMSIPVIGSMFASWLVALVAFFILIEQKKVRIHGWECITMAVISAYMFWLLFQIAATVL